MLDEFSFLVEHDFIKCVAQHRDQQTEKYYCRNKKVNAEEDSDPC